MLGPLLQCPACDHVVEQPTTLICGHTVCAKHVRLSPTPSAASSLSAKPSLPPPLPSPNPSLSFGSASNNDKEPQTLQQQRQLPSCPILTCFQPTGPRPLRRRDDIHTLSLTPTHTTSPHDPDHPTIPNLNSTPIPTTTSSSTSTSTSIGIDIDIDIDSDEVLYVPPPPPASARLGLNSKFSPIPPPPHARIKVPNPKLDVTLSKVLDVLAQFVDLVELDAILYPSTTTTTAASTTKIGVNANANATTTTTAKDEMTTNDALAIPQTRSRSSSSSAASTLSLSLSASASASGPRALPGPGSGSGSGSGSGPGSGPGSGSARSTQSTRSLSKLAQQLDLLTSANVQAGTESPGPGASIPGAFEVGMHKPEDVPVSTPSTTSRTKASLGGTTFMNGGGIGSESIPLPMMPNTHSGSGPDQHNEYRNQLVDALLPELTCEICYQLFYDPVTTPCQHTFCSKCLLRSLDHSPLCPLCREELPGFAFYHDHPRNEILYVLITTLLPDLYTSRLTSLTLEDNTTSNPLLSVPIFPCTLAFPYQPIQLNIFEPRYRLMIRRLLSTGNGSNQGGSCCFGMTMHPDPYTGEEVMYGTVLRVRSVRMWEDGRSYVECVGWWRFRIVERWWVDGYMVANLERIEDYPPEAESMLDTVPLGTLAARQNHPNLTPSPDLDIELSSPDLELDAADFELRPNVPLPASASALASLDPSSTSPSTTPRPSLSRFSSHSNSNANANTNANSNSNTNTNANTNTTNTTNTNTNTTNTNTTTTASPLPLPLPLPPLSLTSPGEIERATLDQLIAYSLAFVHKTQGQVAPWVYQRMLKAYGPVPEDDPVRLSYWIALMLPIQDHDKGKLLTLRSPRLRLQLVAHWINSLDKQGWWRNSGCVVM